jgi:hypothetical protein
LKTLDAGNGRPRLRKALSQGGPGVQCRDGGITGGTAIFEANFARRDGC